MIALPRTRATRASIQPLALAVALIACPTAGDLLAQWQSVNPPNTGEDLYSISFLNPMEGFAVGFGELGGTIQYTQDGGTNWLRFDTGGLLPLATHFVSANNGYMAGINALSNSAFVGSTTDGGNIWNFAYDANSTGFFALSFPTAMVGYAGGQGGELVKTIDGGTTWSIIKGNVSDIFRRLHFIDTGTGFALAASPQRLNMPSLFYKTTDGGLTWTKLKEYGSEAIFGDLLFVNGDLGFAVGFEGRPVIYRTTDGGTTWTVAYSEEGNAVLQSIAFKNSRIGYVVGASGIILRTTDGGETWTHEESGTTETLLTVQAMEGVIYAGGSRGTMLKRADVSGVADAPSFYDLDVEIAPNPIEDIAVVALKGAGAQPGQEMVVYDMLGSEVLHVDLDESNRGKINHDDLPSGMYFYTVTTTDGAVANGRFMVN